VEIYVRKVQKLSSQLVINIPKKVQNHLGIVRGDYVFFAIIPEGGAFMAFYDPQIDGLLTPEEVGKEVNEKINSAAVDPVAVAAVPEKPDSAG